MAVPLNCIVDDSALVASVRTGSSHSIQPWLAQNAINVYVPISALERLAALRAINCPVSGDAQEALIWLDEVTTATASKPFGRVQLQGPDDQYQSWQEVERYLLPDTPLSRSDGAGPDRVDALSRMLDNNLTVNGSQTTSPNTQNSKRSPSASPASSISSMSSVTPESLVKADESSTALSAHGTPPSVRPLLNFVVWRTHHEDDVTMESGKYILVTNDPIIQKQASKFGVRAKLLGQLETILAKAGIKSTVEPIGAPFSNGINGHVDEDELSDDEDRVVFDPSKRPGSSRGLPPRPTNANVIDPDHFGRDYKIPAAKPPAGPLQANNTGFPRGRGHFGNRRGRGPPLQPSPAPNRFNASQGSQRGRGTAASPVRGVGFLPRAKGYMQPVSRGGAQNFPGRGVPNGIAPGARGGNPGFRGRGAQNLPFAPRGAGFNQSRNQFVQKPIDPDSYVRPSPFGRGRGRGAAMHRLWEPTSTG